MQETFWNELNEGEIHLRDHSQFELKSEFFIHAEKSVYTQEFFIFIPSGLQVNEETYPKRQFYLDQTNLFRYKTPYTTLKDLVKPESTQSPLIRLQSLFKSYDAFERLQEASDEIKLFGHMFKVALRDRVRDLLNELELESAKETGSFSQAIAVLCSEIKAITRLYRQIQENAIEAYPDEQLRRIFRYVDEYMSGQIDHYLLILEQTIRLSDHHYLRESEKLLSQLVLEESHYRKANDLGPKTSPDHPFSSESVLHRQGLLNKYILEALMLDNYRFSVTEKHASLLGALAAGIAMFVYLALFAWKVSSFVIDSLPIILLVVFLYVLKDRIKEGVKKSFFEHSSKWFPDFSTEIISPKGFKVGKIDEHFSFVELSKLPVDIQEIRKYDFNEELQALIRHESIIQYKRVVTLFSHPGSLGGRRKELTTIFRLNIQHFLEKASNPFHPHLFLDPYSHEVQEKLLPKVYHINLIIRNTYQQSDLSFKSEIKKFRVVVDKLGIKRVEQIK